VSRFAILSEFERWESRYAGARLTNNAELAVGETVLKWCVVNDENSSFLHDPRVQRVLIRLKPLLRMQARPNGGKNGHSLST
jgi:hypothetical protein